MLVGRRDRGGSSSHVWRRRVTVDGGGAMAWFPGRRRERGSEPSGPLGLNTHWAGWLLRMKN
jgi:hypothetical protein